MPSVNAFIPKPHTPYEDEALASEEDIKEKLSFLQREFEKLGHVAFRGMSVGEAVWEAYLAKMDESGADILEEAASEVPVRRLLKRHRERIERSSVPSPSRRRRPQRRRRGPSSPSADRLVRKEPSMKLPSRRFVATVCRVAVFVAAAIPEQTALALDFPLLTPSRELFRSHREKFLARLPAGAVVVLHAAPLRTMSHDTEYTYRQDSDFYYVTGLEEPGAIAVFRPAAPVGKRYFLYVRPHDARRETFEGPRPGPEGAISDFGADAAFPIQEFEATLQRGDGPGGSAGPGPGASAGFLIGATSLYFSDGGDPVWGENSRLDRRHEEPGRGTGHDGRRARRSSTRCASSRTRRSSRLLRRSSEISARAHARAMAAAAPGRYEFEVQQALDSYCLANGARRMAYPSIVGLGAELGLSALGQERPQMKDGDVLLNDSGAEYGYYASDVTRTYPVNGRFSPEQRAIYEIGSRRAEGDDRADPARNDARRDRADFGPRADGGARPARTALRGRRQSS